MKHRFGIDYGALRPRGIVQGLTGSRSRFDIRDILVGLARAKRITLMCEKMDSAGDKGETI